MSYSVAYRPEASLWSHFVSHAQLGLSKEVQPHETNLCERIGNAICWTAEELPTHIWERLTTPRVVTVATTTFAMIANSFLFYPSQTLMHLRDFFRWLPLPPLWAVRFSTYIYTSALILGYGMRAFGRFSNTELMNTFYRPNVSNS